MKKDIWSTIKDEVILRIEAEPSLEPYLNQLILSQDNLINSVASGCVKYILGNVFHPLSSEIFSSLVL